MNRRVVAMVEHLELADGPMTVSKGVRDHAVFLALAQFAGAVIKSEWYLDSNAREWIREQFVRREGEHTVTVMCLRPPTVVDFTIRNERRTAQGGA